MAPLTAEQLAAIDQSLVQIITDGVQRTVTDGQDVELIDPRTLLAVRDSLNVQQPTNNTFGLRLVQLKPPGGGG